LSITRAYTNAGDIHGGSTAPYFLIFYEIPVDSKTKRKRSRLYLREMKKKIKEKTAGIYDMGVT
jgi:hypothetical protein